jgi:thiamine kinase-like enzyme
MVAALPKAARLKVQQALAQWRHWNTAAPLPGQPAATRLLDGGLSNTSVLLLAGECKFVLRLDGHDPQRLGLSRAAEWRSHQNAAAAGLAPQPVYFNPELGVLVSNFLEKESPAIEREDEPGAIADLLRGIHALPAVKFRLQPLSRAQHYLGLLGENTLPDDFRQACERLQSAGESCLCHNDLLRENRLQQAQRLVAIDWEYAAMGDPWFDLAVICEGDTLDDRDSLALCEAYLQASPDLAQQQRLQDNRLAYRFLAELWQRLTGGSPP